MLTALSLPAQEIYRWTDNNGIVKYSDKIPAHIKIENVNRLNISRDSSFKTLAQIAKQAGKTVSEQQQELEQISKKNCDVATQNVKIMTAFKKITRLDASGNEVILSAEEKEQQLSLLKKQIEIFCTA